MACNEAYRFVLALTFATSLASAGGCDADSQEDSPPTSEPQREPEPKDHVDAEAGSHAFDAAQQPVSDGGGHEDGSALIVADASSKTTAKDSGSDGGDASQASASTFPSVNGKWSEAGPFKVTEKQAGPDHTLYYPTELGSDGRRHPVVIWGNGTGATPAAYARLLRHWASHGFIVAAANTKSAGSGADMLAGARWLTTENGKLQSAFFGRVDVSKVAATGHSQGGGGAIAAGADPLVTTTMPIQPGPQGQISALHGPMFILGGGNDSIVVPGLLVGPRYKQATHIKAVYGLLKTATHFEPANDGGRMRGYMTAWLRSQLMDDELAKAEFFGTCGLCSDSDWTVERNFQ